jgi:dTDP-4-amino-4,6-dideoxygalactose transaminase
MRPNEPASIVCVPNILNRDGFLRRVNEILDRRILTNDGPLVKELEAMIEQMFGVDHCVATVNGTMALELTLQAMDLRGEVIVPSFTFPASVNAIARMGLTPVFCDVEESTGLLDPRELRRLINSSTCAVMPVNLFGNVCNVGSIKEIAKEHKIRVIYDSAQAVGSKSEGRWCGVFGDAEIFSLHATKFINGFEGGFVTTSDKQLAEKLRQLRNFGFDDNDDLVALGTNAKLSEIHAAMALTNFEQMNSILEMNHRNLDAYRSSLPAPLKLLEASLSPESNHQYIPVIAPHGTKQRLVEQLVKEGIIAKAYFRPCHLMKYYDDGTVSLPATERLSERILCLPTGQLIDEAEIRRICDVMASALKQLV